MKKFFPQSIGVIMDGNRRFAKEHALSPIEGHWRGYENFKKLLEWTADQKIPHIIVYAFSTENWKRNKKEVQGLIALFFVALQELKKRLETETPRIIGEVRFLGDLNDFPEKVRALAEELQRKTRGRKGLSVSLALSYGGRKEILRAARLSHGKSEKTFERHLYTHGIPDPDLIIRTGGERRVSNFLLWQLAYSEFFFTDTLWPEFTKREFMKILKEFSRRVRRFGK